MSLENHLQGILSAYADIFGETESLQALRIFLKAYGEWTDRKKNLAGHLTGSALVWHKPSHSVLRVYHAKLNRWVFSGGGHIDKGELPWQTSARELREETGIEATPLYDATNPVPFVIDAHPIPASVKKNEPAHWHYDLIYLYSVDQKPDIQADPAEISRYHWVDVADVTRKNSPVDLRKQMERYGV
ncbi:MAG: NUDIX hydrolase [Alphaproteobacteria bacterium]|nr:NUDIX hydrolase [Alphaproteobacteria bacterium]